MTQRSISQLLAEKTGLDHSAVDDLFLQLSEIVVAHAKQGVAIPCLGEVAAIRGENRQIENPVTGELISAPGIVSLVFKPNTKLERRAVDGFKRSEYELDEADDPEELDPLRLLAFEQRHLDRGEYNVRGKDCNHRIGGSPDWIHHDQTPTCCGARMLFYGQLDSKLGDEYNVADAAMIYVFVCHHCGSTESLQQSY